MSLVLFNLQFPLSYSQQSLGLEGRNGNPTPTLKISKPRSTCNHLKPPGQPVPKSTRRSGLGLIIMMKTISERYQCDCVFQFLMGLNDSYSPIQDQIMLFGPIPIITRVFSIIQQQECQHQFTFNSTQHNVMAFAIRKPSSFPAKFPSHSRFNLATFVP